MTVAELLAKLGSAFPAFNAKAAESWAPVFRARLAKHEGPALAKAYVDTLSSFTVARSKALFPVVADFEANLPSGKLVLPSGESPMREAIARHAEAKRRAFADWHAGQGAKIRDARPRPVYNACSAMAQDLAKTGQRVILSAEQIQTCEERALSAARVAMFGKLPLTNEAWDEQIEQVRALWREQTGERAAA